VFYQLPNKYDWYSDIIITAAKRNLSMRVVCKIAGVKYDSLKYNARTLKNTGVGISYETLQALTDALNSIEGNPSAGSDTPEPGWI
jgi:hypothetical protein